MKSANICASAPVPLTVNWISFDVFHTKNTRASLRRIIFVAVLSVMLWSCMVMDLRLMKKHGNGMVDTNFYTNFYTNFIAIHCSALFY